MKPATFLLLALLASSPAAAQCRPPGDETLLGAEVRTRPAYDGSDFQITDFIPVVRYYGGVWFARTTQGVLEGGARWRVAEGLAVGAQLAYEAGRYARESSLLHDQDIPDVQASASIGGHLEWDKHLGKAPFNLLGRWRQSLDVDRGAQFDLRSTVGVYGGPRLLAGLFAQATWATSKAVSSFYTAGEGGLLFTEIGSLGSFNLSRHWELVGRFDLRWLQGDAASSPITQRRSNFYADFGLAYRF